MAKTCVLTLTDAECRRLSDLVQAQLDTVDDLVREGDDPQIYSVDELRAIAAKLDAVA